MALFATLLTTNADAELPGDLRLSGYGTLAYVQDNRDDITAVRDISQLPDQDFSRGSWQRDSRLGLQAAYSLGEMLDLVGQAVLREQVSQSLGDSIELAYAGLKPTPSLDLRLGRVGYDAFLMSDIRNVGYAYTWARPFTEYYGWIPLFSVDGLDLAWVIPQGEAQWRIKAQGGRSATSIPVGRGRLDFETDDLVSLTLSRQSGPWQVKAGYSSFTSDNEATNNDLAGLRALLAGIGSAEAADLRYHLAFKDARITYATLGAAYNDGAWLLQGELAHTTSTHRIVPHGSMGYAVTGYRMGDWTPYIAYSATRPGNALLSTASGPVEAAAVLTLNSTRMDQRTLSLGTRWDFSDQAALKLQWDTSRIAPHGYGLLFKDPALETRSSRVQQLTLTLDFIF